ncbi:MAG: hypothetical protein C0621_00525 [Desulfuromonas sp.]|nr:MAG: hypothetical protein C0621_00525 [Desulfuromonas sp.]
MSETWQQMVDEALIAAEKGQTMIALLQLEEAAESGMTPQLKSGLGYCLAKERRQLQKGANLCLEAMREEPRNPAHDLYLGRVLLLAGQKEKAIRAFRQGLKKGRDPRIMGDLRALGLRAPQVITGLPRAHPLNRILGKMLSRFGMR